MPDDLTQEKTASGGKVVPIQETLTGAERPRQRRKLAAILMADVSGFSRMMGRDEEGATALIRDFHARVLAIVEAHEGRVVDTAGDSVFGEFDSVVNAMRCAHKIQENQAETNRERTPEQQIETRIGVHLGDVIVEDYRIYGDGVNIAARLESRADPGGILVSEAVYQQVHSKLDLAFEDMGIQTLKNIAHPIRVYRVASSRAEAAVPAANPDPAVPRPERVRRQRGEHRKAGVSPSGRVRTRKPEREPVGHFLDELLRQRHLWPLAVGTALLLSPLLLFETAGVFPAAGAILLGQTLGLISSRVHGRRRDHRLALGFTIALAALFTHWSGVTNLAFVIGGLMVAAPGLRSR